MSDVISIDSSTIADSQQELLKCSHSVQREALLFIMILLLSVAAEIFPPIMLVKLNSHLVALENQHEEMSHGLWAMAHNMLASSEELVKRHIPAFSCFITDMTYFHEH